jgi:hypothetical protein
LMVTSDSVTLSVFIVIIFPLTISPDSSGFRLSVAGILA